MDQPIARIRRATRALHDRLDALPYGARVLDGSVPIAQYGRFLRAVHAVQVALEEAVATRADPRLRELVADGPRRRARLEADLADLAVDRDAVDGSILHALVLAQRVRIAALERPAELLGFAYVLEGSQLGGLVQHVALAQRPELQQGGLSYLAGDGRDTQARFRAFLARLEAALGDEADVLAAIDGATAAFAGFEAIVRSLDAGPGDERWLSSALNDDAGTHPVPADLREVVAAFAAGEQTFRAFAYYGARYGARGLGFTRSDSAWLVTLARELPARAAQQINWLGGVLAARGMPRLLLEQHLYTLHHTLTKARPDEAASYATLHDAAAALRGERRATLADHEAQALIDAFTRGLDDESGIAPREAATLLVAAVVDEQRGIEQAVPSLTAWLADDARFSPAWVAQVARTVADARAFTSQRS